MPQCRACKAPISFEQTEHGKLRPVNADGTVHFSTCPERAFERGPRPPDDECLSCGSDDVERRPGQGPHHGAIKCRDCGAFRWLRKPA